MMEEVGGRGRNRDCDGDGEWLRKDERREKIGFDSI